MKTTSIIKYTCEICGTNYDTQSSALRCEKKPVSHDDVNVGDTVKITGGDGAGLTLKVEKKWIYDMEWGHYAADRYHHTVGVSGPVIGSHGHRALTFDQREAITT